MTVNLRSSSGRTVSKLQRAEPAPCTSTTAGPSPLTSHTIRTPSELVTWRSTAASLPAASGPPPQPAAGFPRAPGRPHERVLVLHVRRHRERLRVPARHEQAVEEAAVG